MYDLPLLSDKLEDIRDRVKEALVSGELLREAEQRDLDDELGELVEQTSPSGNMVCKFCGEPFTDWFERTLHYDTCAEIRRIRQLGKH